MMGYITQQGGIMCTRGTIYQQLNINAERQQVPQPQLLTPDDDQFN
jgi:hypothetical protein